MNALRGEWIVESGCFWPSSRVRILWRHLQQIIKNCLQSHCRWRLNKFSMSTMSLFGINLSTNQQGHVWNTRIWELWTMDGYFQRQGMDIFKNKVLRVLLTGFHTENLLESHSFNITQKDRLQRKHLNFPTYSTHWTHLCEIKSNSKKGPLLYFLKEIQIEESWSLVHFTSHSALSRQRHQLSRSPSHLASRTLVPTLLIRLQRNPHLYFQKGAALRLSCGL